MSTRTETTETTVTLRLSERARAKLAEQAANTGQDLSTVASDLIEHAVTRPSIAQIMSPVWKQAADSGMKDEEIDDLLRRELEAHRREQKAESA